MFDFVLGLVLAALLIRGWVRGLVREVLDLVSLIAGLWIAFRLSAPFGDFLTQRFGVGPEVARIGAGIALFFLFGATMSIAAHYLSKVMRLPGLSMVNRVGGAAVAFIWGVALVLVALNVARVLPLPESWADGLENSSVANAIAGEDAVPQNLFETVIGDSALTALAAIQDLFGTNRVVPEEGEVLHVPPASGDDIRQVTDEAAEILDKINRHRTGLGIGALQPSEAMLGVAQQAAADIYTSGRLARLSDCRNDLNQAGVLVGGCTSSVALASTALGALEGILDTGAGQADLENSAFDRVAVSVVDGPTGRIVVVLLAG